MDKFSIGDKTESINNIICQYIKQCVCKGRMAR